ncbi:hypothetical protein KJ359_006470 [Pestalotiopsis sp. 9143b]|nr:hypothetical protein KJ359_006470 [Pestalotiopsis sp. 9143b]
MDRKRSKPQTNGNKGPKRYRARGDTDGRGNLRGFVVIDSETESEPSSDLSEEEEEEESESDDDDDEENSWKSNSDDEEEDDLTDEDTENEDSNDEGDNGDNDGDENGEHESDDDDEEDGDKDEKDDGDNDQDGDKDNNRDDQDGDKIPVKELMKRLMNASIFQAKKADLVEENAKKGLAVDSKSDSELRLNRYIYEIKLQEERRDPARKKLVPLIKETKKQLFQYLKTLGSGADFDDEVNQLGVQKYKPPVLASILRQFKSATASEFKNLPAYKSSKGGRKKKESSQSNSDTGGGKGFGGGKGSGGSGAESVIYKLADKVDKYWAGLKSGEKLAIVRGYYADQGIQLAENLALDNADNI